MAIKKVAKQKYVNMELWHVDSVTGCNDEGSKFIVTFRGRSRKSKQDFQIILTMDYYYLSGINEKVRTIIQRRIDFQTSNLKNVFNP